MIRRLLPRREAAAGSVPSTTERDFDAELAAVDGDESRLPSDVEGEVLDTRTPELRTAAPWVASAAVVIALAAPGWNGLGSVLLLFVEVVVAVWLVVYSVGTMMGRVTTNDFVLEQAYATRCSVAFFRGQFMLLLGVGVGLGLPLLGVYGLVQEREVILALGAWVGAVAVLVASLMIVGRPRFLLPAVVRKAGPATAWAPVVRPPMGAGKSERLR